MSVIHVTMVRDNLDNIPEHVFPEGYSARNFRVGEEIFWQEINAAAGCLNSLETAQEQWAKEFADHIEEMQERCFFIEHGGSGKLVGTATAWYDDKFNGGAYGRLHWVAITPEFQGKGLVKPLMSVVMARMAQLHDRGVLGTQTFRVKAISVYLDFGFVPFLASPTCEEAWRGLAERLKHPALEQFDSAM